MGRPKGGTNTSHSKEEKLSLVLRNLNGETITSLERETGIYNAQIHKWTRQYLEGGEEAVNVLYTLINSGVLDPELEESLTDIATHIYNDDFEECKGNLYCEGCVFKELL